MHLSWHPKTQPICKVNKLTAVFTHVGMIRIKAKQGLNHFWNAGKVGKKPWLAGQMNQCFPCVMWTEIYKTISVMAESM